MPPTDAISLDAVHRLPPMLFGRIRWVKGRGAPLGEPASAFTILVEEHTASEFRAGPGGVFEVIPGTGIWKTIAESAPCRSLPDEGDRHVIGFDVPDVHLNSFPDGGYRVTPTLTGKWSKSLVQVRIGYHQPWILSADVSYTPHYYLERFQHVSTFALIKVLQRRVNIPVAAFCDRQLDPVLPTDTRGKIDPDPVVALHRLRHEVDPVVLIIIYPILLRRLRMGHQQLHESVAAIDEFENRLPTHMFYNERHAQRRCQRPTH